ncbi:hypothetical protein CI1B_55240 [Bradyrhizobium ivorense]|uniref:Uncharacterized protein n=1 Tax=Bradyrhizobium ivorense TaxID=2511166 RepID=A0A508TKF7_9BRAD|nr:hypothetical protein CI1B_55240 [Bradyrhizobium ivorense]
MMMVAALIMGAAIRPRPFRVKMLSRHSGAMRQHRTRNLEIPDSPFGRPGMTGG